MRIRFFAASALAVAIQTILGAGGAAAFTSDLVTRPPGLIRTYAFTGVGNMPPYGAALQQAILAEIQRTDLPFLLLATGTTFVRFDVDRAGKLVFFVVLKGSGSKRIDAFVEQVVRRAARRFPPPPEGHPNDRLSFAIPIRFN